MAGVHLIIRLVRSRLINLSFLLGAVCTFNCLYLNTSSRAVDTAMIEKLSPNLQR